MHIHPSSLTGVRPAECVRSPFWLAGVVGLLMALPVLAGCDSGPPPTPTPDPRIGELQRLVGEIREGVQRINQRVSRLDETPTPPPPPPPTPEPTATPGPTATPSPTATLTPTASATPGPTLAEIEALIDSSVASAIASAIAALPTPTSLPVLAPAPSLEQVEALIEATVTAAIAGIPTPAPTSTPAPMATPVSLAALVNVLPQVSGPAITSVAGDVTLRVEPGQPLAGRNISFRLEGLRPWQLVSVEFVDPRGDPVEWVSIQEARVTLPSGELATRFTLYADDTGSVGWTRVATQDSEGVWSVRVTIDGRTATVTYPVTQLQLPAEEIESGGVELRRYRGFVSDTFVSVLVPATLAVDFQSHLAWVVGKLREDLDLQSGQIPDIYLLGNTAVLEDVSKSVGVDLGFEGGFFKSRGVRPGIYMRTDSYVTDLQHLLTHEYVHLLLDEAAGGAPLRAWLNEGLAGYAEFDLGLQGQRPDVSRRKLYGSADWARSAAVSGGLLPLPSLESQVAWHARTDRGLIRLQYAESHMAVRFLREVHGPHAPVDVVNKIGSGSTLAEALQEVTGVPYGEFEDRFAAWLEGWEDPQRAEVREYMGTLNGATDSRTAIFDRRREVVGVRLTPSEHAASSRELLEDAEALLAIVNAAAPPSAAEGLHGDAVAYFGRVVDWLALEHEYAKTAIESKRTQANQMIPEIDARGFLLRRAVFRMEFNYQLLPGR